MLWPLVRLVVVPANIYWIRESDYHSGRHVAMRAYMACNVLCLLNIKWTCDKLNLMKSPDHISSLALSIPLLATRNIPMDAFAGINMLTWSSYVHGIIGTHLTVSIDHAAISYVCLVYASAGAPIAGASAALIGYIEYMYPDMKLSIPLYTVSMLYWAWFASEAMTLLPLIALGYMLRRSRGTELWHLTNGLYIYVVTAYKYGSPVLF